MAAKRNGLMPAFLNLSKLVSAPNAAMAMVRRKVSSWLIQFTMLSGSNPRELNPITTRKRMANHGMLILGLLVSVFSRQSLLATSLATVHAITSNTGTSIITLIIFTMMALLLTSAPMALAAPTTWATSWTVEPVKSPIISGDRSKMPAL